MWAVMRAHNHSWYNYRRRMSWHAIPGRITVTDIGGLSSQVGTRAHTTQ